MTIRLLEKKLNCSINKLADFIANPFNLRLWTVHRDLYLIDNKCFEATNIQGLLNFHEIRIHKSVEKEKVKFTFSWWTRKMLVKTFEIELAFVEEEITNISFILEKNHHQKN